MSRPPINITIPKGTLHERKSWCVLNTFFTSFLFHARFQRFSIERVKNSLSSLSTLRLKNYSIQFDSIQFNSTQLNSTQFNSIQFALLSLTQSVPKQRVQDRSPLRVKTKPTSSQMPHLRADIQNWELKSSEQRRREDNRSRNLRFLPAGMFCWSRRPFHSSLAAEFQRSTSFLLSKPIKRRHILYHLDGIVQQAFALTLFSPCSRFPQFSLLPSFLPSPIIQNSKETPKSSFPHVFQERKSKS